MPRGLGPDRQCPHLCTLCPRGPGHGVREATWRFSPFGGDGASRVRPGGRHRRQGEREPRKGSRRQKRPQAQGPEALPTHVPSPHARRSGRPSSGTPRPRGAPSGCVPMAAGSLRVSADGLRAQGPSDRHGAARQPAARGEARQDGGCRVSQVGTAVSAPLRPALPGPVGPDSRHLRLASRARSPQLIT